MPKFNDNIRKLAKDNTDFRRQETHKGDQVLVFVAAEE